ncbi:uncharacterized protein LOC141638258 [Silene latifolia]|uniref:uncharacterized protein LOC141638258 n=1 Tax=Silene latifolia TaxID=37657 RepID=UPI003D776635
MGTRTPNTSIGKPPRRKKNFIARIVDDEGWIHEGTEEVARVAKGYFEGLFTSLSPTGFEPILDAVEGRVTPEMKDILRAAYCDEKVLCALNQMHPLKASGIDAFERFHHMKNEKGSTGHMAWILDMAKAYDRVEWVFLERVLCRMGFEGGWINRVMKCVSSVSFFIMVNGEPSEDFKPSRGLMRPAMETKDIRGILVANNSPMVRMIVFSSSEPRRLKRDGRGVDEERQANMANCLGVRIVHEHDKYLGLPTVVGNSKAVVTKVVREKLSRKLQEWHGKLFTKTGREVLIKVVAQSIPTYAMSIFKLPKGFSDNLRSIVSLLWWECG